MRPERPPEWFSAHTRSDQIGNPCRQYRMYLMVMYQSLRQLSAHWLIGRCGTLTGECGTGYARLCPALSGVANHRPLSAAARHPQGAALVFISRAWPSPRLQRPHAPGCKQGEPACALTVHTLMGIQTQSHLAFHIDHALIGIPSQTRAMHDIS